MKHQQLLTPTTTFTNGAPTAVLDYRAMDLPTGESPDAILAIRVGGTSAAAHSVSFAEHVGFDKAGRCDVACVAPPAPGANVLYRFLVLYQYSPLGEHADLL